MKKNIITAQPQGRLSFLATCMQTIYTVKTCNLTVKRPSQQGTILLSSLRPRPPQSLNIHSLF